MTKARPAEVLPLTSRRSAAQDDLLDHHLQAVLSTVFELQMYGLYLQSSPAKVAGLLASDDSVPNAANEKQKLCKELQEEWQLVLDLEAATDTAVLKKQHCSYTEHQVYRELMTQLEVHGWKSCPAVHDLIRSWYPPLAFSANCETCFNALEDDIKRGQKSQGLSLTGLQALAIRSVQNRLLSADNTASKITLADADWEGNEVRGLKAKMFHPDSHKMSSRLASTDMVYDFATSSSSNNKVLIVSRVPRQDFRRYIAFRTSNEEYRYASGVASFEIWTQKHLIVWVSTSMSE